MYALRYTRCMPDLLESGELRLSPEEASIHCAAGDRLHETLPLGTGVFCRAIGGLWLKIARKNQTVSHHPGGSAPRRCLCVDLVRCPHG